MGLNVSTDEFTATTPQGQKKMVNIVGELAGETKTLILITSHYDSKFFKDMHFVGANDPAASVGTCWRLRVLLPALLSNQNPPTDLFSLMVRKHFVKVGMIVEMKPIQITHTEVDATQRSSSRKKRLKSLAQ
jgi:hypothetical protein